MSDADAAERIRRLLRLAGAALDAEVRLVDGALGGEPVWRPDGGVAGCLVVDGAVADPALRRSVLADVSHLLAAELGRGELDALVEQLVRAREAAETVAERLRLAASASGIGTALLDDVGRILFVNPSFAAVVGHHAESLLGRTIDDVLEPTDLPDADRLVAAMRSGDSALVEYECRIVGDEPRWARLHRGRMATATGGDAELVQVVDITSQRLLRDDLQRAGAESRAALDALEQGVALVSADGRVRRANPSVERILGADPDAVGRLEAVARALTDGCAVRGHHETVVVDGTHRSVRVSVEPIVDGDGAVVVAVSDVTAEERSRTLLDATFEAAPVGMAVIDPQRRIMMCNPMFEDQAGRTVAELVGSDVTDLLVDDDQRADARARADEVVAAGRFGLLRAEPRQVRRPDGTELWVTTQVSVIPDPDQPRAIVATFDVTEELRLQREMQRLTERLAHGATHDALTDLANRTLLDVQLDAALARAMRGDHHVGVCFIDLDGFKAVNDSYGHDMGDRLLREIADRLRQGVRAGDLAARIGGDEFVVMLDPVDGVEQALVTAERLRQALVADMSCVLPGLVVGASIGVAVSGLDDTPATMVRRADAALYRAKSTRRSGIELAIEPAV